MTDGWLKEMDNSKMTGAVLLDFSAAFDVIDHNLLIGKLKCYGFSSSDKKDTTGLLHWQLVSF